MQAPFVDHKHGMNLYFYRITYPIKIVNYSGWGVETKEEELRNGDCALVVLKSAKRRAIKEAGESSSAPPARSHSFFRFT
jgi:hypothetical protein